MARQMRKRHLRHGRYNRVRRSDDFIAFLAKEQSDLNGTGAAATFTLSGGVAATGTLTLGANPTDGDTLAVGGKTYRFKNTTAQANDVKIGANAGATGANLVLAIGASGAGNGTDYHTGTTANANVTAAGTTTVTFTAKAQGVAGNLISLVATMTSGSNVVSGALLTGGVDRYIVNKATHGFSEGAGPFVITAATTLPGGYSAGTLVWVKEVLTSGTFSLTKKRGSSVLLGFTDAGVGTLTLTKASTTKSVYEILKRRKARTVSAATDIDTL